MSRRPSSPRWEIIIPIIISAVAVVFALPAIQQIIHVWLNPPVNYEQKILTTNFVGSLSTDDVYIRSPLEKALSELIGHKGSQYVVVVGPKCCGKSTLVNHVIEANPIGVIPVSMSSDFTNLYSAISVSLGSSETTWNKKSLAGLFNNTIQLARRSKKFPSDWVPTIVVELDRATTDESVHNIARDIKLLCSDTRSCRGVLVLSDALAAFAIPKDTRARFFWVDDFTEDLAHQYFDALNFLTDPSVV